MQRFIEQGRVTRVEFIPPIKFRKDDLPHGRTVTRMIVDTMEVGDCLRINHDDVMCQAFKCRDGIVSVYQCSLASMLSSAKSYEGKRFEYYHEDRYIAVVRRLK